MSHIIPDFSSVRPEVPSRPKEMLSVRTLGNQTEVRINSSSLGIILSCLRKAHYTLFRMLKARTEAPALTYGTAIHKALEVFYSHSGKERNIPNRFNEFSDLMAYGADAPEAHFLYDAIAAFVKTAEPLKHLPDTDMRSLSTGVYMLQHYFKTYIKDPYVIHSDTLGPMTERFCEALLYEDANLKVILFGTIDFVLRHEINGSLLPGDHKTTSQLGTNFFSRLKPNHQYSAYVFLAKEVLGLETDNFLVNALQVKARPLTVRGTAPSFARQITSRSYADLIEFKQSVLWAVRTYLNCADSGVWPIGHVNECASYGACHLLDVCSAPDSIRENIIESRFMVADHTKQIGEI